MGHMKTLLERHQVVLLLSFLALLAWCILWLGGQSPYGHYLHHGNVQGTHVDGGWATLAGSLGWLLMIIAMMLPTSLPLVAMFDRMTSLRSNHGTLVALLVIGYLGSWMLFGLITHLGDGLLRRAIGPYQSVQGNAGLIGACILVLAGLFQFTPFKDYCLQKCRSPFGFLIANWGSGRDVAQAFRLGVRHGLFCIGCCWLLMLLMFVVGLGNLGWMFILGTLMAFEKNHSWGMRFSAPLGIMLIGWGSWQALLALA